MYLFFTIFVIISLFLFWNLNNTLSLKAIWSDTNKSTLSLKTASTSSDADNSKTEPNVLLSLFSTAMWIKLRLLYYVNNWVYTTNHKRIAVNYYYFVIFSGICGMVLATIIRLEMAYPGVGILAGDSLQYLSVVTAHAVIMVFFMIMPLLFGAFGNFLLPTQLGVHDVAFPRLNSAAFWFLPAGLLMLVQLVCLDRRYQRMNCYNIREIQTILKSKYSPSTSEPYEVKFNLNDTTLGLRHTLNELSFLDPSMFTFYKNALLQNPTYKATHAFLHKPIVEFDSVKLFMGRASFLFNVLKVMYNEQGLDTKFLWSSEWQTPLTSLNQLFEVFTPSLTNLSINTKTSSVLFMLQPSWLFETLTSVVQSSLSVTYWMWNDQLLAANLVRTFIQTIKSNLSVFSIQFSELKNCFSIFTPTYFYASALHVYSLMSTLLSLEFSALVSNSLAPVFSAAKNFNLFKQDNLEPSTVSGETALSFSTNGSDSASISQSSEFAFQESLENQRFVRFMNPVFKYDFKVGNYMPDDLKKLNPHLFNTIKDITTGIRKPAWFASDDYTRLFKANVASHLFYFGESSLSHSQRSSLAASCADFDGTFSPNSYYSTNVTFTGAFFNFFTLLNSSNGLLNTRWLAINALEQKFYKMFANSSMQQRIHANWRQLKFTREAWRCKLLAARHQNTLYKRYLNEDSVVWAVERNAKDVLPGWAMITPFSARSRFTAIGKVDIGLMGVFLVLNSSIVSSANFLVTYRYLSTLNNRKMRDARSFFTEGVMVASWMMIAANPMLAIGILMLLSDRHWQTSFFDYSGGGDTVLFQHMFWFFGHPEVYVIMIPAFGFNNTILSFYLRKRVSARASLMYSMYTIAFLGFFVWGHHMYMVGLAHTTRMLFSTLTVMISVPAATKLMHWCVTLVNSSFVLELPMFFQLLFIFFFVSGGISGMAVAHTGMDILFHDSFYVVGHFHVMLAGSAMFASFGAFYFYFPAIFGVKYSRLYGYLHAIYYLTGQLMTVIPMFWLGYAAMPRRVLDYPAALGGWHAIVSAGHMLSVAGMMAFFIMIFDSIRQGRAATRNSFGVARFNTRLNFYIYEGARTWFLQRKGWYLSRFNRHNSVRLNKLNYTNNEYLETTLYSYVIVKSNNA